MLITNAHIINEEHETAADVLIRNGRIEKIAKQISAPAGTVIYDAKGQWLLPGLIDDQVHFREPGLTHKGDLYSESRAAVAGGVTTYFDMPNNKPAITTRQLLAEKYAAAQGRSFANYAFYFGGANDNLEEVAALQRDEACAIKVFMGASTGDLLVSDDACLRLVLQHGRRRVAIHAEDEPRMQERANLRVTGDPSSHPVWRSPEVISVLAETASAAGLVRLTSMRSFCGVAGTTSMWWTSAIARLDPSPRSRAYRLARPAPSTSSSRICASIPSR